ncbi:unnamed protein product [Calypogeia fissa]
MGFRFFLVLLVLALAVACQSGPSTSAADEFDGGGGVTCVKRPPVNVFFWEELEKILVEDLDELNKARDRDEDYNRLYILQDEGPGGRPSRRARAPPGTFPSARKKFEDKWAEEAPRAGGTKSSHQH